AIAAVGSFAAAVVSGLDADARRLLGGDVEVRIIHRPLDAGTRDELAGLGTISEVAEMRAMAVAVGSRAGDRRTLVELKAVDDAYPLVGAVETDPAGGIDALLRHSKTSRGVL